MGLAGATKKLEVPGDPGQYLTIRQLNWVQLAEAKDARLDQMVKAFKMIAGVTDQIAKPPTDAVQAAAQDPMQVHDRLTVLRYGVAAWTYEGQIDVERFDERTSEWAAREILAISVPSEEELGKGSSSSTST